MDKPETIIGLCGYTKLAARGGEASIEVLSSKNRQLLFPRAIAEAALWTADTCVCEQGEWRQATIKSNGVSRLWHTRWEGSSGVFHDVYTAQHHPWPVAGQGMVATSNLQPGNAVQQILAPNAPGAAYRSRHVFYTLAFVEETDEHDEVFYVEHEYGACAAFALASGMLIGCTR